MAKRRVVDDNSDVKEVSTGGSRGEFVGESNSVRVREEEVQRREGEIIDWKEALVWLGRRG